MGHAQVAVQGHPCLQQTAQPCADCCAGCCCASLLVVCAGQTGSGKTYTMGSAWSPEEENNNQGVIPNVMDELFTRVEHETNTNFTIKVSFVEIHKVRVPCNNSSVQARGVCRVVLVAQRCCADPFGAAPAAQLHGGTHKHVQAFHACIKFCVLTCVPCAGGGAGPAVDKLVSAAAGGHYSGAAHRCQLGRRV